MKKILTTLLFVFVAMVIASCNTTATDDTSTGLTTTETVTTEGPTTTSQPTVVTTIDRPSTTEIETTTVEPTTVEPTTTETPTTIEEPTTVITTQSPELVLVTIEVLNQFYEIGDSFDESKIVLTAQYNNAQSEIIDPSSFRVRGFSSELPGTKQAFIQYDSFIIEFTYFVLESYAFEINETYYAEAVNLKGELLKIALNEIVNGDFTPLLYGNARDILQVSDEDPNNPDNIILVYTRDSIVSTWNCSGTDCAWNREHVWPQSRLGVRVGYDSDDFPSKATDMHNLKPADPDENSRRSNDYFDNIVTNDTYEPHDEVKGDIARILFYMATMYLDLTLNDDVNSSNAEKTMGILSVLLEWNELDPVDDFERNRNEVIFSYQGNRNPFIDYPEFANLIWGSNEE